MSFESDNSKTVKESKCFNEVVKEFYEELNLFGYLYNIHSLSAEEVQRRLLDNTLIFDNPEAELDDEKASKVIESIFIQANSYLIMLTKEDTNGCKILLTTAIVPYLKAIVRFIQDDLVLKNLSCIKSLEGFKFSELSIPIQRKFKNANAVRCISYENSITNEELNLLVSLHTTKLY